MISAVQIATSHRDDQIAYVGARDRHSQVTAETVARKFRCGLETAQKTLKATTQRGVRHEMLDHNIPTALKYMDMLQAPKADADDVDFETFNQYLNAKFMINNNGEDEVARVTKRARDNNGKPIRKAQS